MSGPTDIAKLAPRRALAKVCESLSSLKTFVAEIESKKQGCSSPIRLTVPQEDEEIGVGLDYHGGPRYPRLERRAGVLYSILAEWSWIL
jgi:hypothetical protein